MFGRKTDTTEEDRAANKLREEVRLRADVNGSKPSTELTKRELLAMEIYKRLSLEDYEDVEEYAVRAADNLLIELAK